jgi:hypothetical protein
MDQSPPQEASYRLDNQKNSKPFMKDTVYYHGLDKPSLEGSDDGTRQSEKKIVCGVCPASLILNS